MTLLNYPSGYALLTQRLQGFGAFRKRWAWLFALAWFVILGPGSLLALVLLDWLVPLPWYVLLSLFVVTIGLTVYSAIRYALLPLLARIDVEHEALILESLHGSLDNQIIGSLQLGREVVEAQAAGRPVGYSIAIVSALVTRTSDNIGALNLTALVDRTKAAHNLTIAAAIIIGSIVLAVAAPRVVAQRAERIRDAYATLMDLLFPVNINVTPGDKALVRGMPVSLGVEIAKARRHNVRLILTDLKTKKVTANDYALDADHKFNFDIASAQESFTYQFEYGGRRSLAHKILVGDLPAIAAMNTELTYPIYTGMPSRTLVGRLPRIQALQGTEVLVSIASTVELDPGRSYVVFSGGQKQGLTVTGRFAHFSFRIDREEDAAIHLTGALGPGFEMREPATFKILPQIDLPPKVSLLLSQKTKALGATEDGLPLLAEETLHFGLSAIAEDDFGVSEMWLEYKIDTRNKHLENLPQRNAGGYSVPPFLFNPPQDRVKYSFAEVFKTLSPPLMPGERVTLTVWAKDTNPSPGNPGPGNPTPGKGRSESFTFTVVQPDLGTYVEQQFGFGADPLLGGLKRVQRATNLLIEAERTTHTEAKGTVEKQEVKSRVGAENWPGGAQDAVGDYFRLLSGEK